MTTYVKLTDGTLEKMPTPKGINLSETYLAAYATKKGYKRLKTTTATSQYHTCSYREYDDYITTVWTKPSLADLQTAKLAELDTWLQANLATECTITVNDIGSVVYCSNTQSIVTGLVARGEEFEYPFILADGSVTTLDKAGATAIFDSLALYVASLYTQKITNVNLIVAAESVDDLLTFDVSLMN